MPTASYTPSTPNGVVELASSNVQSSGASRQLALQLERQTIVCDLDSFGQMPACVRVLDVMRNMRQQGPLWFQPFDISERLLEVHMGRMLFEPERIDDQQVETLEPVARLVRNEIAVGHVCKPTDAECSHRQLSVNDRQRLDLQAHQIEVSFHSVWHDSGNPRIRRW